VNKKILIKGAGEQASAVAHRLFKCGFPVVMTEIEKPTAVRRQVSFCSAIFEGEIEIEGVKGVFSKSPDTRTSIPVLVDPECKIIKTYKPDIIIDARIMKKNLDNHIDDASLVIGLGPGLEAGKDVHFVVETNRGHNLGRIITKGLAEPDTKVPGTIAGFSAERVVRAPKDGLFKNNKDIGDPVSKGEIIGNVGEQEVRTEISGILRGLIYPGLEVRANQKIGDIDPRGELSYCNTISDKARTISGSVLEIILSLESSV